MRYFLAIPLPEDVKQQLHSISRSLSCFKGLKMVSPDNMHLTLLFLGNNEASEKIEDMKKLNFSPFFLKTSKLSVYPEEGKIRLVWVELDKSVELMRLQKKLSVMFGMKKDFKPHITIARVKKLDKSDRSKLCEFVKSFNPLRMSFKVKNFKLYSSELTVLGPVHRVIEYFEFVSGSKKWIGILEICFCLLSWFVLFGVFWFCLCFFCLILRFFLSCWFLLFFLL